MKVERTPDFVKWFNKQHGKIKIYVDARLESIQSKGYFGDHKFLGDHLLELRWKNGLRVYYSLVYKNELMLVLLGGFKNAQKKDISKAKRILKKYLS